MSWAHPISLEPIFGLHVLAPDLAFHQMVARTLVVFAAGLVFVRLGDRRLLGSNAGFDVLVWVILGSVLSRGITGQAPFVPTLGTGAVIVLLHHLLALAAFRSHAISRLVKGDARTLIKEGRIQEEALKATNITADDLEENLRIYGNLSSTASVKEARLERNGAISVVRKN